MLRLLKGAVLTLCENIRPYVQRAIRPTAIPFELKVKYKLNTNITII